MIGRPTPLGSSGARAAPVARWSTDLLRFGGLVDFDVEGPGYAVGEARSAIEPGEDQNLGEVRLRPGGAVFGRARALGGGSVGKVPRAPPRLDFGT